MLQINSVKAVERAHRVAVSITKGCIEIKGLQREVSEATYDIQKILAQIREEKFAGVLRAEVQYWERTLNFDVLRIC